MRNFLIAALLLLRFFSGKAEIEEEEEEINEFLYDYASRFGDYLYATAEYYSENTTFIPTMYSYTGVEEEPEDLEEDSVGLSLRCHLPLVVTLSLLPFLL